MPILRIICLFLLTLLVVTFQMAMADAPDYLKGKDYQQRLDDPGLASLSGLKLRETLRQIEQAYHLASFRDRRIDPEQTVELAKSNGDVRKLLTSIGEAVDCRVSFTGQLVYVGPESNTRLLRSLIAQRTLEIRRMIRDRPNSRLMVPQAFLWPVLSQPRELVIQVAANAQFTINNPELIEHDVWSAGTIPEATVPEILSILLLGFDLTFEISEDRKSITLVPIPTEVDLYNSEVYTLKSGEKSDKWQRVAPAAEISASGQRVTVSGLVEDHEAIRDLRSGKRELDATEAIALLPLSKRRFTLTLKDAPAAAVLKELEKSGIQFAWDPQKFASAKIDFNNHVMIDVQEVTAEEFFQALLEPLGIEFDVSGVTVTMRPKE
ncbi:hypothetical protein OAK47_00985 [Planctomycetaceae bacterium]|jgi:hypothetical protein|nr:hypothetical protein [Planctomycetaceae bacterium]MDG2389640.1 hypothetical protein [Planctomycetaceae bacterium]